MSRHWEVRGSMPAKNAGHWRENVVCHVVTDSARRALDLVEAKYAGITIHSVYAHGKIDIIEDAP